MTITSFIRYEIDPFKKDQLTAHADAWASIIPSLGGYNRWRDQMVADLRKVMKLNRHNSLLKTGRIAESLAEQQAIMAALLARDTVRTQERLREHFEKGLEAAE